MTLLQLSETAEAEVHSIYRRLGLELGLRLGLGIGFKVWVGVS